MNVSKQAPVLALMSILVSVASAQTIPAEQWVGPSISTTGGQLDRASVLADLATVSAQSQAPQQLWVGSRASADIVAGQLRRLEVMADFNLFARAGLADRAWSESFDPFSTDYLRRMALYARLVAGPEFVAEVARLEGSEPQPVGIASAAEASAE